MDSASPGEDGRRSAPRYRIVDHILSLPGANLLRTAAVERYGALKKRSALAAGAMGVVEKFAALAYARLAEPAAEKFSGPLQVVDDLSCKVLENLENGCSVVSKGSLKVIGNTFVFGKLKYSEGQACAHAKIDACWKLSGSVLNAARHPVDTAVSIVRCVGNTASEQLAIAEWACDSYIRDMPQGCPPENDPRKCALPRFINWLWKASVRVTGYVITERQRARDLIERTLAAAKRVLLEPTGFLRYTGGLCNVELLHENSQTASVYGNLERDTSASDNSRHGSASCPEDGTPGRSSDIGGYKDGSLDHRSSPEIPKHRTASRGSNAEDLEDGSLARGSGPDDPKNKTRPSGNFAEDPEKASPRRSGSPHLKYTSSDCGNGRDTTKGSSLRDRGPDVPKNGSPGPGSAPEGQKGCTLRRGSGPPQYTIGDTPGPESSPEESSRGLGTSREDPRGVKCTHNSGPGHTYDESSTRGGGPECPVRVGDPRIHKHGIPGCVSGPDRSRNGNSGSSNGPDDSQDGGCGRGNGPGDSKDGSPRCNNGPENSKDYSPGRCSGFGDSKDGSTERGSGPEEYEDGSAGRGHGSVYSEDGSPGCGSSLENSKDGRPGRGHTPTDSKNPGSGNGPAHSKYGSRRHGDGPENSKDGGPGRGDAPENTKDGYPRYGKGPEDSEDGSPRRGECPDNPEDKSPKRRISAKERNDGSPESASGPDDRKDLNPRGSGPEKSKASSFLGGSNPASTTYGCPEHGNTIESSSDDEWVVIGGPDYMEHESCSVGGPSDSECKNWEDDEEDSRDESSEVDEEVSEDEESSEQEPSASVAGPYDSADENFVYIGGPDESEEDGSVCVGGPDDSDEPSSMHGNGQGDSAYGSPLCHQGRCDSACGSPNHGDNADDSEDGVQHSR